MAHCFQTFTTNHIHCTNVFSDWSLNMSLTPFLNLDRPYHSLVNGDLGGDLGPEAGVLDGRDLFLGVTVHVHVQHHAAEGGAQVIRQILIRHAAQDQIHVQLARDLIDGQILTVQTHPRKQVQLVPVRERDIGITA